MPPGGCRRCVDCPGNLPVPQNSDYVLLAKKIAPNDFSKQTVDKARKQLLAFAKESAQCELRKLGMESPDESLQAYVTKLGELRLRTAIHRGQYTHSEGLLFGGTAKTWSNKTFRNIVTTHVLGAWRVVLVDIHTGLGPYGHG